MSFWLVSPFVCIMHEAKQQQSVQEQETLFVNHPVSKRCVSWKMQYVIKVYTVQYYTCYIYFSSKCIKYFTQRNINKLKMIHKLFLSFKKNTLHILYDPFDVSNRVKLKDGVAFLGARASNPVQWTVSQDVRSEGHRVVTLHCRRKEANFGKRSVTLKSVLLVSKTSSSEGCWLLEWPRSSKFKINASGKNTANEKFFFFSHNFALFVKFWPRKIQTHTHILWPSPYSPLAFSYQT